MSGRALERDLDVGVVGAGAMGAGIALVAASAGHRVRLFDAVPGAADRGKARLAADLDRLVQRGKLAPEEAAARIGRIIPAPDLSELRGSALVIEAIIEDLQAKAEVLGRLEALLPIEAVVASNTSSLSITALASRLSRPARVLGMHFFNPAQLMPLVEVVSGAATDPSVADLVFETAKAWGKVPVRCGSTPGFIVNRIARPYYGEALRLAADHAASPETLDAIMRDCGGFRMGPFELMDLIGHDVNFAVTSSVYEAFFHDPRYRPSLVQKALVEAGRLGRKSGRGFFGYGEGERPPPPQALPPGPAPKQVEVAGDLGPAAALTALFEAAGVAVVRSAGEGVIRVDGIELALTDGRTATERSHASGIPTAVFDLALDYVASPRIALALPAGMASEQAAAAGGAFQALGKSVSLLDDVPGMAVARTMAMLVNEAADGLQQGLASAADIDLAMVKGANYPIGPLAWCDRLGPSWVTTVMDALAAAYPDGRYRTSALLRRYALTGGSLGPSTAS